MNVDKLRHYLPIIEFIVKSSKDHKKSQLESIETNFFKFVLDFLLNLDCGNLPIDDLKLKEALKPYKKKISSLVMKKKSFKRRKTELLRNNTFSQIFTPLISFLQKLIISK